MIFVDNEGVTDPRLNLALEEHLLRNLKTGDEILLFYINEPAIIIGRNQNTLEEINVDYVQAHDIHVVRRLSGGGAVYHDLGNLNFSFITENLPENVQNFRKFTAPVIRVLNQLGVPAQMSGRNDILAGGRKISGNAQYIAAQRMVTHGTLLFNSNLSNVAEALQVKMSKISSKGIKSVRSRVANIVEFLPEPVDILSFRSQLLDGIFKNGSGNTQYTLTTADWEKARSLADQRYNCWDWNYGNSPAFNLQKTERFVFGEIDARIDVQKGIITQIRFYGDFFGQRDLGELEEILTGVRYDRQEIEKAVADIDLEEYIGGMSQEDFFKFLY